MKRRSLAFATSVATLLAALLVGGQVRAADELRYALLIGANQGKPSEAPLRFAVDDTQRLQEVLTSIGGFLAENVVVLAQPTPDRVRDALARLYVRIRGEAPDRSVLLVFYSGHADAAALHLGAAELPWDELRNLTAGSPATSRLLVIDACRSGQATRVKGTRLVAPFAVPASSALLPEGFAVLSSATAGESAQESDDLRSSFFTHHFVSGLRGVADANGDGLVSLTESYQYAADRTIASTASTLAGIQHPTYLYDLKGRTELVLTRPRHASPELATVRLGKPGQYLFRVDGPHGRPVLEASVTGARREGRLPAGRYFVQRRVPERLYEGLIVLAARQVTDLDGVALRPLEYDRLVRKGGGGGPAASAGLWAGYGSGLLPGYPGATHVAIEASLDFSGLTADVQIGHWRGEVLDSLFEGILSFWGVSVGGRKVVDVGRVSLSAGLRLGLAHLGQRYDAPERVAPARGQWLVPYLDAVGRADLPIPGGYFLGVGPTVRVAAVKLRDGAGGASHGARPQIVVAVGGGKRW